MQTKLQTLRLKVEKSTSGILFVEDGHLSQQIRSAFSDQTAQSIECSIDAQLLGTTRIRQGIYLCDLVKVLKRLDVEFKLIQEGEIEFSLP